MGDRLLGFDPADFGNTGLTLGILISVAMNDPGRVLPRSRHHGNRDEPLLSWRQRAVTQLLKDHGVDLDTKLTRERNDQPVTSEQEFFDKAHEQLDRWALRLTYMMTTADVYVVEAGHYHAEPHYGDVHEALQHAMTERSTAIGRNDLLTVRSHHGFPIALDPRQIASIRPDLTGPDGKQILPIKPGWMDVADDEDGEGAEQ